MSLRREGGGQVARPTSHQMRRSNYVSLAEDFLETVWSRFEGFGFIGIKNADDGHWAEHAIRLQYARRDIREVLEVCSREQHDLYFCPNPFSRATRKQDTALSTLWGWCDIDDADPAKFRPRPSILLRTSPGRYQGLWRWDKWVPPRKAERYSHALTYRFDGDPGGWSITKYLRLPHTFNHKPQYDRPLVRIIHQNLSPIVARPELMAEIESACDISPPGMKPTNSLDPRKHTLKSVYHKYRTKLKPKTKAMMMLRSMTESDRSKQIYMIVADLHSAGASPDEIASVLWVNPYFIDKYGRNLKKLNEEIYRITRKLGQHT